MGWDIGPGNCLMDAWVNQNQGIAYDADGLWAMQGEVINSLLDQLLSDPFLGLAAPRKYWKRIFFVGLVGALFKKRV